MSSSFDKNYKQLICFGCNRQFVRRKNLEKHKSRCKHRLMMLEEKKQLEEKGELINNKVEELNNILDQTFSKEIEVHHKLDYNSGIIFKQNIIECTNKLSYIFDLYNEYSDKNDERIVKVLIELLEKPIDDVIHITKEFKNYLDTL